MIEVFGITHRGGVRKENQDEVRLLELRDPPCSRELIMTCTRNKTDNSVVEDFFRFLTDYCQRQKSAAARAGGVA